MARLNKKREQELQPKRYDYAKQKFEELGYEVNEYGTGKVAM